MRWDDPDAVDLTQYDPDEDSGYLDDLTPSTITALHAATETTR